MVCCCRFALLLPDITPLVVADGELADAKLSRPFVHCPVSQVAAKAAELLPDKAATIICFCGVGARVMGAKEVLEEQGYTVLNAGGLKDLVAAGVA